MRLSSEANRRIVLSVDRKMHCMPPLVHKRCRLGDFFVESVYQEIIFVRPLSTHTEPSQSKSTAAEIPAWALP
jgi:hypothetical protein